MAKYAKPLVIGPWSKFYKDLTIDEKINAKSWGSWRLPNPNGYMLTMIDNAIHDGYETGHANYARHHLVAWYHSERPKPTKVSSWRETAIDCRRFISKQ